MANTVIEILESTAEKRGGRPALRHKEGGEWRTRSWSEYRDEVRAVARGMIRLGLPPGGATVILGFNRPEWFLADLGTIAAGGTPVGIYTTSSPEQVHYIAHHCEASIAVLERRSDLDAFLPLRPELPALRAIVLMEGESDEDSVLAWSDLLRLGNEGAETEAELASRIAAQRPDDPCTLIYTSGTTGPPKGVMLSHRNLCFVSASLSEVYGLMPEDRVLSYLPLSHIAEQVVSLHCPMQVGAECCFAESLEKLPENLREVHPTIFFAVPRVWEKIQARIQAVGAQASPLRRMIASWAKKQGLAAGYASQGRGRRPWLHTLAERLVFSKVRDRLGLDRARICVTSAAPISLHTLELFLSLGIPVLEVYGMSECTGPTTFSTPERFRTGKAGFAIPGTELRTAADGEVQMRGPHVFLGYYKNPEATRETLDEEGWLHSGDIGEIDGEAFLRITDRKKEIIITSGGKNVAPQLLEGKLKAIPGVSAAVLIGERKNYLTALLTLDPETLERIAEKVGSSEREVGKASACPKIRRYLEDEIAKVNATLARYETIKRFAVLGGQLTIEGGELTPTMKLKRRVVNEKYAEQIESLYR